MFKHTFTSVTVRQRLIHFTALLGMSLMSALVLAQTPMPELSVKLYLERSTIVDGKEKMVITERAAPGEVLQYVAVYSNQTHLTGAKDKDGKTVANERILKAVTATLPIPEQMAYLGKATPAPQLGSSDGKVFANYPLTKTIKQADGSNKTVPLEWSEYRALRWTLADIAPKASSNVSAAVQVSQKAGVQTANNVVNKP
jgi:hypothetical protein